MARIRILVAVGRLRCLRNWHSHLGCGNRLWRQVQELLGGRSRYHPACWRPDLRVRVRAWGTRRSRAVRRLAVDRHGAHHRHHRQRHLRIRAWLHDRFPKAPRRAWRGPHRAAAQGSPADVLRADVPVLVRHVRNRVLEQHDVDVHGLGNHDGLLVLAHRLYAHRRSYRQCIPPDHHEYAGRHRLPRGIVSSRF